LREKENELKKKMDQLIKDNEELNTQLNIVQEGMIFLIIYNIYLLTGQLVMQNINVY